MQGKSIRISRKNALSMDELIHQYILEMKISAGVDRQLVFSAWDKISGAGMYTTGRFFRDGILHVNLSSSMVRTQIQIQKRDILEKMNEELMKDELFTSKGDGSMPLKDIVLH